MQSLTTREHSVRAGDWVDVRGVPGRSARRGEIVEVLGDDRHRRYRVRWDESHESIVYPADGFWVVPPARPAGARR